MKKILLILMLFPTIAHCQKSYDPCDYYINRSFDEITGKTYITTKPISVTKDHGVHGLQLTFMLYGEGQKEIALIILSNGEDICIPENNKVYILFHDNTRLEITSVTNENCRGNTLIYFNDEKYMYYGLEYLKSKKIKAVRVMTSSSSIQEYFSEQQSNELMFGLNCLADIYK